MVDILYKIDRPSVVPFNYGDDTSSSNQNETDSSSNIVYQSSTTSLASSRDLSSRSRAKTKLTPQRVDMAGNLAISDRKLDDFHNQFQAVLKSQGYDGLSPHRVEEEWASSSDEESSLGFDHYPRGTNEHTSIDRPLTANAANSSFASKENSQNQKSNDGKNSSPDSETESGKRSLGSDVDIEVNSTDNSGVVGIGDKSILGNDLPSEQAFLESSRRLAEMKRKLDEMRGLKNSIGVLTESYLERGAKRDEPQTAKNHIEWQPEPSVSSASSVPPPTHKAAEDSVLSSDRVGERAATPERSVSMTTAAAATAHATRTEVFDGREVATGAPSEEDHTDLKTEVSILLNTTTSTIGEESHIDQKTTERRPCRLALIVLAVFGLAGVGIYIGYMSYMIHMNKQ
ncbi:unnamed protein product [Pseudo-nitzschia multistriata]|uniref:Uncharacterized protein n=1 Tax=Pseudo-nitzschia multistriata TaxID=183589 RepID=A0A448Z3E2_9STRA|nr:unnamed protein product [Pseudo-nitzschia multistriata]